MAKKRANGEGNIRKRKDGRWEGRYTAGYDPITGKRINKNVLGRTQAEVKEKLNAALAECKTIDILRAEDYTVATWLRTWYDLYAKPNIRLATADRYHLMIESYTIPRIGNIKLTKLTSRQLQKLYKDLMEKGRTHGNKAGDPGLSSTTIRSVHLMLHCAFERAVKERLIPRNPTDDCIAPKVRKVEMKILPPRAYESLVKPESIFNPLGQLHSISSCVPLVFTKLRPRHSLHQSAYLHNLFNLFSKRKCWIFLIIFIPLILLLHISVILVVLHDFIRSPNCFQNIIDR